MFIFSLSLLFFASTIHSFTPNCVPENQFRNFGFPVEACSEHFQEKCKFHPKGYFKSLGDASLVKLRETTVIPTCAFYNAQSLTYIYGVNNKIKVLATGAFMNLPNLEAIHLQFNHITEVRKDVFKNVSVVLLDLSWNKIAFIDSDAFKEVSSLKFLNLSRNSLATVPLNHLGRTLKSLNLAYNLLESFALNSNFFLNLTSVDASNNLIGKVAILFQYPAENFDFTNNRIQNFDYMDIFSVNKFKMGKNLFEYVPRYLKDINAHEIDIYPNPWKCNTLFLLWETLVSFNIHLAPKEPGKNPPPECFDGNNRITTTTRSTDCLGDHECPSFMTCRAKRCWDPCEQFLCHDSNFCETKNHVFNCSCSDGLLADPMDLRAECKNVECFTDSHCQPPFHCWDQKCVNTDTPGSIHVSGGSNAFAGGFGYPVSTDPLVPELPPVPWWFEDIPIVVPSAGH